MTWPLARCLAWTGERNPNFLDGDWRAYRWRLEGRVLSVRPKLEEYLRSGPADGPYRRRADWPEIGTTLGLWVRRGVLYLPRAAWSEAVKFLKQWEYVVAWLIEWRIARGVPILTRVVRRVRRMRWLRWGRAWLRGHDPPG